MVTENLELKQALARMVEELANEKAKTHGLSSLLEKHVESMEAAKAAPATLPATGKVHLPPS